MYDYLRDLFVFKELYNANIEPMLISNVIYPIIYLNCIFLKVLQAKRIIKKSVFLALGINIED